MKKCSKCNKLKEICCFGSHMKRGKKHIEARCKDCRREDRRISNRKNYDKQKQWNDQNKEARRKYHKEYQRKKSKAKKESSKACENLFKLMSFCSYCSSIFKRKRNTLTQKEKCKNCERKDYNEKNKSKTNLQGLIYRYNKSEKRECTICKELYKYSKLIPGTGFKTCSINCRLELKKITKQNGKHRRRSKTRLHPCLGRINKNDLFIKQKGKCNICNCKLNIKHKNRLNDAEIDHIIPLSKGGFNWSINLQLLCRGCNNWKGDRIYTPMIEAQSMVAREGGKLFKKHSGNKGAKASRTPTANLKKNDHWL